MQMQCAIYVNEIQSTTILGDYIIRITHKNG